MYEKISEKTQKKEKILEENAQERKMRRMKDDVKPFIYQLWDFRGILFISNNVNGGRSVQEATFAQQL